MARANPQWRGFDGQRPVLAIFSGPHAYVSPAWYETAPAVPTWNYLAVHVSGAPRVIANDREVRALLKRMVAKYEAGFARPWRLDLPEEFMRKMVAAIVAFEIPIARIEGKFKLSQNRSAADRRGAIAALMASTDPRACQIATMMSRLTQ